MLMLMRILTTKSSSNAFNKLGRDSSRKASDGSTRKEGCETHPKEPGISRG
jgi:hypothetical protein